MNRQQNRASLRADAKTASAIAKLKQKEGLSRGEARALFRALGLLTGPVRFEQSPVPVKLIHDESVRRIGQTDIWLVDYVDEKTGKKKMAKVQLSAGMWTCSCRGWRKTKSRDCEHIVRVKGGSETKTNPFIQLGRTPSTHWLFPDNTPCYDTRLEHARIAMPQMLPGIIELLCDLYIEEPKHEGRGAIGIPMKVRAYALMIKVALDLSLEDLQARLEGDPAIYRLGWNKPKPPNFKVLSRRFGQAIVGWREMGRATADPCKLLDDGAIGDSYDLPTVRVQNSRDLKAGVKMAPYRSHQPLVRHHFLAGRISGVIYMADVTESQGHGAGDNLHFPYLLKGTKAIVPDLAWSAFDLAYGSYRNFRVAEDLFTDLVIRSKQNENRLNGEWPALAERMAIMEQRQDGQFDDKARFRPKAESTPKRIKDRNPQIRLRKRKSDKKVIFPDDIDYKNLSRLPEEVIQAIEDLARENVGVARLNESHAIFNVANIRRLVIWMYVLQQWIDFRSRSVFAPIRIIRAKDLLPMLDGSRAA